MKNSGIIIITIGVIMKKIVDTLKHVTTALIFVCFFLGGSNVFKR